MKQSQPSKITLLACLLAAGALAPQARAGSVTYDFTTDPTTGANPIQVYQSGFADGSGTSVYWKSDGGNPGGFLGVTWPIGSSTTIVVFPDIDQGKIVTGFSFETDLRIGNPQQNERAADGFSINFARSTDPIFENHTANDFATAGAVETGSTTGLAICFDTWSGNALPDGGDIEGIIVRVDNKTILRQSMPTRNGACDDNTSLQTGPRDLAYWTAANDAGTMPDAAFMADSWKGLCWQHLKVDLDETGKLSVVWKGRTILDKFQTTFFPSAGGIVLAGRTGGADEHTHFDNLKLTTTATAKDTTNPTVPGNLKVASSTAEKVVLTWDAATDDSGRVGYLLFRDDVQLSSSAATGYTDLAVLPGKTYVYKVQAIDPSGNKSAFSATASATLPNANPVDTPGLLFEYWGNISGTPVSNLTDDPRYQAGTPDTRALASAADTRTVFADDSHENYGGQMTAMLIPKESGNYEFFLRSDDASQLWLAPDDKLANLAMIAEETGCCAAFMDPGDPRTSAPIALTAGKKYAFRVIWKEGGGGDYAQVAWRKQGDTTAPASLTPIPGEFFMTQYDITLGAPIFTKKPQSAALPLGGSTTLTAEANIGSNPKTYQWSVNGKEVAGATGTTFAVNNFQLKDIGSYAVTVKNDIGQATASASISLKFDSSTLFVEAEDFNYGAGKYVTDKPTGMTGAYPGNAYLNLGTDAESAEIDYHANGNNGQTYRPDTQVSAGKNNAHPDGLPRGDFSVQNNWVVGWNDAGEWYNYTRQFPTPAKDYYLIGRLASGGNPIHIQMDEVTAGAKTATQTLKKIGEFNPKRATPGWDNMEFFPLVDDQGNPTVIKGFSGEKTFRMTMLPDSAEDMDYFAFVPVTSSTGGNAFTSVTKSGNNLVLTWSSGTLEQADKVNGPYTAVPNATSPATVPITGAGKFYRLK